MDNNLKKLIKVYDDTRLTYGTGVSDIDLKKVSSLMAYMYSPGPSFHYIFNFDTFELDYASESVRAILGEDPENIQPKDHLARVHPNDVDHYVEMENLVFHFTHNVIPREEMLFYKVSYQYRLRTRDGNYALFLHQVITLAHEDGKLSKTFVNLSDISHITNHNNGSLSLIGFDGRPNYLNIKNESDFVKNSRLQRLFTFRELEIIKLIAEGKSSTKIASVLHISKDTVRTHRQNIISKSGKKKITRIISDCIHNGLI